MQPSYPRNDFFACPPLKVEPSPSLSPSLSLSPPLPLLRFPLIFLLSGIFFPSLLRLTPPRSHLWDRLSSHSRPSDPRISSLFLFTSHFQIYFPSRLASSTRPNAS